VHVTRVLRVSIWFLLLVDNEWKMLGSTWKVSTI
jgi:hypothetical protein